MKTETFSNLPSCRVEDNALFTRMPIGATHDNMKNAVKLVQNPNLEKVTLFAGQTPGDLPDEIKPYVSVNAPLVAMLIELMIPGLGALKIVVDEKFLTAVRDPRAGEVSHLLDAVQACGKGYFSPSRIEHTAPIPNDLKGYSSEAAYTIMAALPRKEFNASTRSEYWALLSGVPEDDEL